MIINYPTGLYNSVIPIDPSDSGNVTFTISNSAPPRTNLVFPKLPTVSKFSQSIAIVPNTVKRRSDLGDLIFTTSSSMRSIIGNADKTFEMGQILDFANIPVKSIDPMLVSNDTQIRHDVNSLNYDSIGIDDDDLAIINVASVKAQESFTIQLNNLKLLRANAEIIISNQQKIINDTNRAISAMQIIYDQTQDTDIKAIIDKLKLKLDSASVVLDAATTDANNYARQAELINDNLRTVSTILQ